MDLKFVKLVDIEEKIHADIVKQIHSKDSNDMELG
jgi:hypothetical protein